MGIAKVENADDIKCTLSFTMTLKDWKQIRKTLQTNIAYSEIQVINEIHDLVGQLEKTFWSDVKQD